jgi:uncharacterized protein
MLDRLRPSLKGGKALLAGFFLLLALLFFGRWAIIFYVDLLWFSTLDLSGVYWTRILWEWGVRLFAAGLAGGVTWVNLKVVSSALQGFQLRRRFGDLVIQEKLPESYVRWTLGLAAAFAAFWFAAALPQGTGLRGLLLFHMSPWGMEDPILGRDLSFYVFVLPVLQGIITFGLILTVFMGALALAGYAATGSIAWERSRVVVSRTAGVHLGVLAGALLLLVGFRFHLAPYELLLDGTSGVQGIFGYADEHARVPAYRMMAFLSLVTAVVAFWGVRSGRLLPAGAGVLALAIGGVAVVEVYPALVQRFEVQPNELERERPYISHAVDFTRFGFGLDGMTRSEFDYTGPDGDTWARGLERIERLPIWTDETLLSTFRQIEARFQYYDFHEITFGRYAARDTFEPVAVSVREIDPLGIPAPVSWQNLHLRERYIAGMGAVAGLLSEVSEEGRVPMFLSAIPPEYRTGEGIPDGLELVRPSVYVGSRPQPYAVITPSEENFLSPGGAMGQPGVDFPEGVRMGSIFRTLALAWRFQDANLFLASEVERDSHLVFRRNVTERVRSLAPFLHLPEAPYPVIASGQIYWVLEGFTVSRSFPLSTEHAIPGERGVSYLRNSVKATIDAVTGEVRLYVADESDPIIAAYRSAFPSLFHDVSAMPDELASHLRYSRYYLDVQGSVLIRFHQENPAVFHGQQDRWALATELSTGAQPVPYRPEYSLMILPGEEEESYVLSTLFVPQGRQNLASFLKARWTVETGPELLLWDVPVEEQVRGPRQIEAMIEQDPDISQQFSLWRQGGSQVWTGHMHLVPVGNTLLYMEPVFLAADSDAIPEIRRFLVSDGERVIMDPSLSGAVEALAAGMTGVVVAPEADVEAGVPDTFPGPAQELTGDALATLERAEESLRQGDWEAFGRGLDELRRLLQESEPQPPGS